MAGGEKQEVFNTRERAVSNDLNRLQSFAAQDRAEVLRRLTNMRQGGTAQTLAGSLLETGGYIDTVASDAAVIGTPPTSDVFDGLTVRPQDGTLSLFVDPGVIGIDDPDGQTGSSDPSAASPDDSRYKEVVDAGIQTNGVLLIGAGSGSTRVDTIECQRTTEVTETDNRDVFDPATGTVIPVSIPKVQKGSLLFRVRAGTPGAGLPAPVQGWVPLCVAVVPSTATTVDTMDFWDVRPYVKGRIAPGTDASSTISSHEPRDAVFANALTVGGATTLTGIASGNIGMYVAGGYLIDGSGAPIDIANADFQVPGFTPAAGDFWNLVAIFPRNLPRWVRYLNNPLPRQPAGPSGVIAVTGVGPPITGVYTSVTPPTSSGIGATGQAAHLLAGLDDGSTKPGGLLFQGGLVTVSPDVALSVSPTASTLTTDRYDLVQNDHFPANAKTLLVSFNCTVQGTGDYDVVMIVHIVDPTGAVTDLLATVNFARQKGTLDDAVNLPIFEVPNVYNGANNGLANDNLSIVFSIVDILGNVASRIIPHIVIYGWRL